MPLLDALAGLENTKLAQWVQADALAFPVLEGTHVVSVALVFGSIALLDLRLLGLQSRHLPVTRISDEVLPWTWAGFVVAVITGSLLFVAQASAYLANDEFVLKMVLLALAGLNLAVFHVLTWPKVEEWNERATPPVAARAAALLSLGLWMGVVISGRWIGWTLIAGF